MARQLRMHEGTHWKERFRAPAIVWTQLATETSPRGLVVNNKSRVHQLHAWDVPTGDLRQLTFRPKGVAFGVISSEGRHIYYLEDQRGDEIGHYMRIPFEGGPPEDVSPSLPPYSSSSIPFPLPNIAISRAGNLLAFILVDQEGFHLCRVDLGPGGVLGPPRMLYDSSRLARGPLLSHGGEVAVLASAERAGAQRYSLLAFDTTSGKSIGELWEGPEGSLEPIAFSPRVDDFRLVATTNRTGVRRPFIWDLRTMERADPELDELGGEVVPVTWSADAGQILLCQFDRAVQRLYIYDLTTGILKRLRHPSGTFTFYGGLGTYFGPGGEIFAQWQDSTHPPQLIALDPAGAQTRTVLSAGDVPPGHPWRSVVFSSSDGVEIQGWLGVPEGKGPFPTILHTHGGPQMTITEMFAPGSQAWLDHGFAFLTINYRGSVTFGREFQEKIWGNPGHWEVEDMVAARHWLVSEGIANPTQVLLTGGSYGGYLTLMALGKHPNLWAGGMAQFAIADFASAYEDASGFMKGVYVSWFEGTPEEKPEQYEASSPITHAENVRVPVLVLQGRNDTRCPARQMELYEAKMKSLGKSITVHWFDEGHSSLDTESLIAHQELMLRFACGIIAETVPRPGG